jgi:hypothetical protein
MAKAIGLSVSTVQGIWRAFGLQPHRTETFKLSTDPNFVAKVRDVVVRLAAGGKQCARRSGKVLAMSLSDSLEPRDNPRERFILEHAMKHQRHFGTGEAAQREAVQIWKMIGDLDRSVQLLDCDIAIEEERTMISDRSNAAYSILARMLVARRHNLRNTIAALEHRISEFDQVELVAEVA